MTPRTKCNTIAGLLFVVVSLFFYMLIDRDAPYEYLSGEILPPDPGVGSQVSVHWNVRVNRFCHGWVQRDITDRRGYVWHNVGAPVKDISNIERGQLLDLVNTLELPRQLGPGTATYQAHVCYRCNPLQKVVWPICLSTPKLWFEIK